MEYAGDVIHFGEMKARVHKYETSGFSNFCFEIFRTKEGSNEFWNFPCVDSLVSPNLCLPSLSVDIMIPPYDMWISPFSILGMSPD